MDWSKGFSSSYYLTLVDPVTWRDTERIEITGGSIVRKYSGLRQSADIDCTEFPDGERWVRVWLDATQGGDSAHVSLFTGLTSAIESSLNGNQKTIPLSCYSVLKPLEDVLLEKGYYVYMGSSVTQVVFQLLQATPAPSVVQSNSPELLQTVVAERNENHLTMIDKLLTAVGWRLWIDGDGTIHVGEWNNTPKATFGVHYDVIEPKVNLKADWFRCPNVFRAISGEATAIARDDSVNSPLSTVNRGREVWREESNVKLTDEGIQQYAQRRLAEEQAYAYSVRYSRRYNPDVKVSDVIRLHYPEQNLMGDYAVISQRVELGYGATTQEEVQR